MFRYSLFAAFALIAMFPSLAEAQPRQHGRTVWDTEYRSIGGQHVGGTRMVLDGQTGSYSNRYVQGSLFNIRYEFLPNGDWLAIGEWQSGRYGGTFEFRSENGNPRNFRGTYTVRGRHGRFYWNGWQCR